MINGAHVLIYSKDSDADRDFFRDVLGFRSVDAGQGWLIFALPPAEAAFHPAETHNRHELYFMCDDVRATVASLQEKGVSCSPVVEQRWGITTSLKLPSGGEIGLYQPLHPSTIGDFV